MNMFLLLVLLVGTVYGCDVNGVKRSDGEEFISKGKYVQFVQKCEHKADLGWTVKTIGCLNKAGERHPLGAMVDGQKCEVFDDGRGTAQLENIKEWQNQGPEGPERPNERVIRAKRASNAQCEGRSEGVEWDEGTFRLACFNNNIRFVGCYTSDRTYIPAGSTGTMNKFTFKCEANESGVRIYPLERQGSLEQKKTIGPPGVAPPGFEAFLHTGEANKNSGTLKKCRGHEEGEEWTVGSFKAQCLGGETKWIGCFKNKIFIPLNQQQEVDGFTFQCQPNGQGIKIQPVEDKISRRPSAACEGHDDEQEWRSGNFLKRCVNGKTEFTGCFRNGDDFIPMGRQVEIGKFTFECRTTPSGAEVVPV
ncbi:unnamed protein product [Bursaphelenchus xylophilus]|uniref:(pine wood nematode) hypothetical protein n=1 Tax=Bursaphelenchus xylophilus TaxID=6326 RepID=A0A1I7S466_BURXY|nr:unnamed protein product [Bursaphelenchus xylophilus]CAG9116771.1 unnamed protein product [Bursaphelenchus xylophilus]